MADSNEKALIDSTVYKGCGQQLVEAEREVPGLKGKPPGPSFQKLLKEHVTWEQHSERRGDLLD